MRDKMKKLFGINISPVLESNGASYVFDTQEDLFQADYILKGDMVIVGNESFINLTGSNESMVDYGVRSIVPAVEENKEDIISINIPTLIRLFEYCHETIKNDVEIHEITENMVKICNEGRHIHMDDYESIIGKSVESTEGLKNKTHSTIVINMENIDQANALTTALNNFSNKASVGGDVEMFISTSDDKHTSCGIIGHDVTIGKIYHNVPKDDKKD